MKPKPATLHDLDEHGRNDYIRLVMILDSERETAVYDLARLLIELGVLTVEEGIEEIRRLKRK